MEMRLGYLLLLSLMVLSVESRLKKPKSYSEIHNCHSILSNELIEEISSYESVVNDILDYVIKGPFKGTTYDELANFIDKFGPRPSGSEVLEKSIDYMINLTKSDETLDVLTEPVDVPHYIRGDESLTMISPRNIKMKVLGLGGSSSTDEKGVEAEVVVVASFEELNNLTDNQVRGKIVLFNAKFTRYGETVIYRSQGATKAAKRGAVAALVRSITPFSINTAHTGMTSYENDVDVIPTAAVTIEDAEFINRLISRGENVVVNLKMSSVRQNATSRNTLIDLKGSLNPEKLVVVSGHIDSWDVGQGAMDDGGGLFVSWAVPIVLKRLNLRPKRTIRAILWTAEEVGLIGAQSYEERHRNESNNLNFVMESDEGTFKPTGLSVAGTQELRCIIAEILNLFKSINATKLEEVDNPGSDITVFTGKGIPGAGLSNQADKYFWFHHTEGDTMTVEDSDELDLGTALWTGVSYVIADLSIDMPKKVV